LVVERRGTWLATSGALAFVAMAAWLNSRETSESPTSRGTPNPSPEPRPEEVVQASANTSAELVTSPVAALGERVSTSDPAMPPPIDFHGRVLDERGDPLAYFGLRGVHRDANNFFVEERRWEPELHDRGEFALLALAPGRWEISPFAPHRELDETHRLTATRDQRFEFVLAGRAWISGVVLDPAGKPVRGASVSATPFRPDKDSDGEPNFDLCENRDLAYLRAPSRNVVTTNDGGAFELRTGPGHVLVTARCKGFAPSSHEEFVLAVGERVTTCTLRLEPPLTVRVRVLDFQGSPRSDVRVVDVYELDPNDLLKGYAAEPSANDAFVFRYDEPCVKTYWVLEDSGRGLRPLAQAALSILESEQELVFRERPNDPVQVHADASRVERIRERSLGLKVYAEGPEPPWMAEPARAPILDGSSDFELPGPGRYSYSLESYSLDEGSVFDRGPYGRKVFEVPDDDHFELVLEP
jgi:hypothetical protein